MASWEMETQMIPSPPLLSPQGISGVHHLGAKAEAVRRRRSRVVVDLAPAETKAEQHEGGSREIWRTEGRAQKLRAGVRKRKALG